jgi:hypothetical protein
MKKKIASLILNLLPIALIFIPFFEGYHNPEETVAIKYFSLFSKSLVWIQGDNLLELLLGLSMLVPLLVIIAICIVNLLSLKFVSMRKPVFISNIISCCLWALLSIPYLTYLTIVPLAITIGITILSFYIMKETKSTKKQTKN